MKGFAQEQQEMEMAANRVMRGCGMLFLIVAIIAAAICLIVSIL